MYWLKIASCTKKAHAAYKYALAFQQQGKDKEAADLKQYMRSEIAGAILWTVFGYFAYTLILV